MNWTRALLAILATAVPAAAQPGVGPLERIVVAADGRGFARAGTHTVFHPWGVNYGHAGRLWEDLWEAEWPTLAEDFAEIRSLGANLVRVHLQFGKFMRGADQPDAAALARLRRLVALAETTGLYLDLTGLAGYRPSDRPEWYDKLEEPARWAAQAAFWRAVAGACAHSPAVFCYDLMNEPISPAQPAKGWYSGTLFGAYDFVAYIARDPAGRTRTAIATAWIDTLVSVIRENDPHALVTVGMLPWVTGWGHLSGLVPTEVAPHLDFLSVHIYPKTKDPAEAPRALAECAVGKPVVIEETFPLDCSTAQLATFLRASRTTACGWVWHYDGIPIADYDAREQAGKLTMPEAIWRAALRLFVQLGPEFSAAPGA